MLKLMADEARRQGVLDRVIAVHCDLGRAEWQGVRELAQQQCDLLGIPLLIVNRPQGDLVDQIRARGMFPAPAQRYCTSDQKTGQVRKVFTQIVKDVREADPTAKNRQVRILNCLGLRIDEGKKRQERLTELFASTGSYSQVANKPDTNGKREVTTCHPIAEYTEADVWAFIRHHDLPYHKAYDLGMPRLSCVFCFFAPRAALLVAGRANPELLDTYVAVEEEIDHTFKRDLSLGQIREAIAAGEQPDLAKLNSWGENA